MIKSNINLPIPNVQKIPKDNGNNKIKEACDMYESLYVKKMLDIAYKDINIMGDNIGSDIYKDMYLEELSKTTNGQMGLSKMLFDFLKNKQ